MQHRQKTQPRSHPQGAGIWARGFRTQAKQLMGLLEAVKCGVSQSAELAGSDQTRERQRQPARRRLVGGQIACPPIRPGPSFSPHHVPPLRTKAPGIRLQATQKTPSAVSWADVFPRPKFPSPSPQNGAVFGNRASKEVIKLKHSHVSGHCPYKEGIRTQTHTQGGPSEDAGRRPPFTSAKGTIAADILLPDFRPPELGEKTHLLLEPATDFVVMAQAASDTSLRGSPDSTPPEVRSSGEGRCSPAPQPQVPRPRPSSSQKVLDIELPSFITFPSFWPEYREPYRSPSIHGPSSLGPPHTGNTPLSLYFWFSFWTRPT